MSPDQYIKALKRIEALIDLDPDPDSKDGSELIKLVSEVETYERRIYPMARVLPDMPTV